MLRIVGRPSRRIWQATTNPRRATVLGEVGVTPKLWLPKSASPTASGVSSWRLHSGG
jgi:hypothetical protein